MDLDPVCLACTSEDQKGDLRHVFAVTQDDPDSGAHHENVEADIPGVPPADSSHDGGAMLIPSSVRALRHEEASCGDSTRRFRPAAGGRELEAQRWLAAGGGTPADQRRPRQNSRFWMSATNRIIIVGGVPNGGSARVAQVEDHSR